MFHSAATLPRSAGLGQILSIGAIAGLAGGAAEILWIAIWGGLSAGDASAVARGVTDTVLPAAATAASAVPLGITIHMAIAIVLGIAIATIVPRLLPRGTPAIVQFLAVVGVLIGIWAMNFFVVLPAINPAFIDTVPYAASLVSKILFGVATAFVLQVGPALRR